MRSSARLFALLIGPTAVIVACLFLTSTLGSASTTSWGLALESRTIVRAPYPGTASSTTYVTPLTCGDHVRISTTPQFNTTTGRYRTSESVSSSYCHGSTGVVTMLTAGLEFGSGVTFTGVSGSHSVRASWKFHYHLSMTATPASTTNVFAIFEMTVESLIWNVTGGFQLNESYRGVSNDTNLTSSGVISGTFTSVGTSVVTANFDPHDTYQVWTEVEVYVEVGSGISGSTASVKVNDASSGYHDTLEEISLP
jgi:hypothetical protein